jgi:hypothetical protein
VYIAVVCVQGALIVVCATNAAAVPANVARARERSIAVLASRFHVAVVCVQSALVVVRTTHTTARPAKIARTRE